MKTTVARVARNMIRIQSILDLQLLVERLQIETAEWIHKQLPFNILNELGLKALAKIETRRYETGEILFNKKYAIALVIQIFIVSILFVI